MFRAKRTECVRGTFLSPWFLVVALFTSGHAKGLTDNLSNIDKGPYANQACCACGGGETLAGGGSDGCEDVASFLDEYGYACDAWAGFDCAAAVEEYGYTEEGTAAQSQHRRSAKYFRQVMGVRRRKILKRVAALAASMCESEHAPDSNA